MCDYGYDRANKILEDRKFAIIDDITKISNYLENHDTHSNLLELSEYQKLLKN